MTEGEAAQERPEGARCPDPTEQRSPSRRAAADRCRRSSPRRRPSQRPAHRPSPARSPRPWPAASDAHRPVRPARTARRARPLEQARRTTPGSPHRTPPTRRGKLASHGCPSACRVVTFDKPHPPRPEGHSCVTTRARRLLSRCIQAQSAGPAGPRDPSCHPRSRIGYGHAGLAAWRPRADGPTDLPLMTEWVDDASQAPVVLLTDGSHLRSTGLDRLFDQRVRVLDNEQRPTRREVGRKWAQPPQIVRLIQNPPREEKAGIVRVSSLPTTVLPKQ